MTAPLDLDALEALERAGTKAPWHVSYAHGEYRAYEGRCHGVSVKSDAERAAYYDSDDDEPFPQDIIETDGGCYGPSAADAELLVQARNALPRLLAIVRAGDALAEHVSGSSLTGPTCRYRADEVLAALAKYEEARNG